MREEYIIENICTNQITVCSPRRRSRRERARGNRSNRIKAETYELKGDRVALRGRFCGVREQPRQARQSVRRVRRRRERGQRAAGALRVRALLVEVRAQETRVRVHLHELVNLRAGIRISI